MFKQEIKQSKLSTKIFFLLILFILIPNVCLSKILFSTNFDDEVDWQNNCERGGIDGCGCGDDTCSGNELIHWEYWNLDEMWNPTTDNDLSLPQIRISTDHALSGKSLKMTNESHRGRSGDGWGSDGIIMKTFEETPEVWIQFKMRFQHEYPWYEDGGAAIKLLRVMHNGGYRPVYFSGGGERDNAPMYIYDAGHKDAYINNTHFHSIRCSAGDDNYMCSGDYAFPSEEYQINVTDDEYHTYKWYLKMNSGLGVADGVLRHYVDDILVYELTNISWKRTGDDNIGWNMFGLGGNNHNGIYVDSPPNKIEDASGTETEQWYSIDDVVVSTTPIPDDYVIGGNNIHADVDQNSTTNSTDAMLTLRNSLGLNMSSTNWQSSTTTGDVNCDGVSNSTDAMLILRHSLGLNMSGTGWCED